MLPVKINDVSIHVISNVFLNVKETEDSNIYEISLPGLSKDDINIVVNNQGFIELNVLKDKNCQHILSNLHLEKLRYDYDKPIKAVLSKGVLTITVPRKDYSYVVNVTEE